MDGERVGGGAKSQLILSNPEAGVLPGLVRLLRGGASSFQRRWTQGFSPGGACEGISNNKGAKSELFSPASSTPGDGSAPGLRQCPAHVRTEQAFMGRCPN